MKIAGISSSTVAVIFFACRYTPVFVFGIILSNRYLLENRRLTDRLFCGLGVACILYEILLAVDVYQSLYGIAAIVIAYLVISGAFINSRVLSNSILIFLGKISYNIYLIHNQFGRVIISRLGGQPIVCVLFMILTGLTVILIAYVFSKLEMKMVKCIDKAIMRVMK